jgi:meso-butanediol dehydrogenase / (S,S)-butanediol dehydrogenase / diacetyl reductase
MPLLKDKVIFITGGSAGIGAECASTYAREGATVALCGIDEPEAREQARSLGEKHMGFRCDVSRRDEVRNAIDRILKEYGRLDAIHNNAGIASPSKSLDETTEAEWDRLFEINLKSVYWTTRYGLEALKASKGCILNTSSLVGVIGQEIHAAYTATKGAMITLTKSMALDYARYGIRVNAVCPAGTWTPLLRQWVGEQPNPQAMEDYLNQIHAMGYCPQADVIADASAFLISSRASFITGHIMHVSGGAELGYRKLSPEAGETRNT